MNSTQLREIKRCMVAEKLQLAETCWLVAHQFPDDDGDIRFFSRFNCFTPLEVVEKAFWAKTAQTILKQLDLGDSFLSAITDAQLTGEERAYFIHKLSSQTASGVEKFIDELES